MNVFVMTEYDPHSESEYIMGVYSSVEAALDALAKKRKKFKVCGDQSYKRQNDGGWCRWIVCKGEESLIDIRVYDLDDIPSAKTTEPINNSHKNTN